MLSSRPSIKDLATLYKCSHFHMIQMLIDAGVLERKGSKGNRARLYPLDVMKLQAKFGSPLNG